MRKGQITIFIILGLVLLITLAVVIYFVNTEAQKPWKETPKIPEDIRPVADMINDCTKQSLKRGLITQGLQGGYIDIPGFVTNNPDSYMTADPLGVILIPYWYYNTENRIPSYNLMKIQLGNYIEEEIQQCVNFKSFEPKYMIEKLDKPKVLITYAEEEVVAEVKWLLRITTPEKTTQFSDYYALQNVKFKQMYELGIKILEEENKQEWLEQLTIDFMTADPSIPFGGMEITCKQKKWDIDKIKEKLNDILFYNIPLIRIKNTPQLKPIADRSVYENLKEKGEEIREDLIAGKINSVELDEEIPEDIYEINKMTFNINIPLTNIKAGFVYGNQNLLLSTLPHDGKWLKSRNAKGSKNLIPFFCMNQWHFTYDVIYPINVQIKDEEAFEGEGFVFQYGLPVIINDNSPERINFGVRQFEPIYTGAGFCEETEDTETQIKVYGSEPYNPVAIELNKANISIQCVNIECNLGQTEIQENGEILLKTRLPIGCGNPLVIAKKDGYLETKDWLTDDKIELQMKSLQELKPEFVIQPFHNLLDQWQTEQNRFNLDKNEKITLSLRLKDSDFEQYLIFPTNETISIVEADEEYELEIYLLKNDQIIGGYKNENLIINYEGVIGKEKIQFNIIEYRPNPSSEEELGKMLQFLDDGIYINETYQERLRPLLK